MSKFERLSILIDFLSEYQRGFTKEESKQYGNFLD